MKIFIICLSLLFWGGQYSIALAASACTTSKLDPVTLQLDIPCVIHNDQVYTASMQLTPQANHSGLVWKLDPSSLNPSSCTLDTSACSTLTPSLGLSVHQLDIAGDSYRAELANIPITTDSTGLYWQYLTHQLTTGTRAIDIRVSYYDTYANTLDKQQAITANFQHFSEALYEASNGAHRLGKVTVFTDGGHADNTDILWLKDKDNRGQPCWFNSQLAGYGHKGKRLQHCDIGANNPSRYGMLNTPRAGGYTLAHEWGHFFYGLYDEYKGKNHCSKLRPFLPCVEDIPTDISIMNTQWNAINSSSDSLSDIRWLNFSTAQSGSTQNAHYRMYSHHAWDTLTRSPEQDSPHQGNTRAYYPELVNTAPATGEPPSIEIDTPEGLAAALQDLQVIFKQGSTQTPSARRNQAVEWVGTIQYLIIDHSTAVSAQYLHHLKAAAQSLVDQSEIGDVIAVIAVDEQVTPIQALTLIDSEATRDTLIAAIETIQTGQGEAITGEALTNALQSMQSNQYFEQFSHAVYLFTHGKQAEDDIPLRDVATHYAQAGTLLFILADNQEVSVNHELHQIAELTGGEFYRAATPRRLQQVIETVHQSLSPSLDVTIAHQFIVFENMTEMPFYLDESLGKVDIRVEYEGSLNDLTITLHDPQGIQHPFTLAHCQDVIQEAEGEAELYHFCTQTQQQPLAGHWMLSLQATQQGEAEAAMTVSALPKDNSHSFFATVHTEATHPLSVGQSTRIFANLSADFPITQLQVTAGVETEDEQLIPITVRDDGVEPDTQAEDGIYTGQFTPEKVGKYLLLAEFDNTQNTAQHSDLGVAYAPDQEGNVPVQQLIPINMPFQRFALNKIWVVD